MIKHKILFSTEASYLSSGYSRYYRALLEFLHKTNEFDICELGAWGSNLDPRSLELPWKFIGNLPDINNQDEITSYESNPYNKFGAFKFDEVCARFNPSIILAIRDIWHEQHIFSSPFRPYYNIAIMPAVDGTPQKEEWISNYNDADYVLTYTDWAKNVLDEISDKKINTVGTASPVCDSVFYPYKNKKLHKEKLGFNPNFKIIGTVMRNQKRKSFPQLFKAFEKYIHKNKVNDTFLYCHTSWPDDGWDIPSLLKDCTVANKILFTYLCQTCGETFPSFFRDGKEFCPKCKSLNACMPNTNQSVSNEVLANIYNLFDIYVQHHFLEGFGMPVVEAAGCGVIVTGTDYSAVSETLRNLNGYPVNVKAYNKEMESGRNWAIPDDDHLISILENVLLNMFEEQRIEKGLETRKLFEKYYNSWDNVGKKWYDILINIPHNNKRSWNTPPQIHIPAPYQEMNCTHKEYATWLFKYVLGDTSKINSYMYCRLIKELNYGNTNYGMGGQYYNEESCVVHHVKNEKFDRKKAYDHMVQLCEHRNFWERKKQQYVNTI